MRASRSDRTRPHGSPGGLPVWLPWLCAPGFMVLPMAGCGIAGALKQPPPSVAASARFVTTEHRQAVRDADRTQPAPATQLAQNP